MRDCGTRLKRSDTKLVDRFLDAIFQKRFCLHTFGTRAFAIILGWWYTFQMLRYQTFQGEDAVTAHIQVQVKYVWVEQKEQLDWMKLRFVC